MCTYTLKKQNLKKKSSRGVRDSTDRSKIRRLRRKGYRKKQQRLKHLMLHTGRI